MTSRKLTSIIALASALVLFVSGCGGSGEDSGAKKLAAQLATALTAGDVAPVAFTTTDAAAAYTALNAPLKKAFTSRVTVSGVAGDGADKATATLRWSSDRDGAIWTHDTKVALVKDGTWKAVWAPSILESSLVDGETIMVTGIKARRGSILGQGGRPLVEPRPVVRFGIDKDQAGDSAAEAARRLAAVLDLAVAPYVQQVTKAGPKALVPAVVLRRSDVSSTLLAQVAAIDGARAIDDELPLAPTKDFAAALLGTVGPATAELIKENKGRLRAGDDTGLSGLQARYDELLSGVPGVEVTALPAKDSSAELRVLFSAEPTAGNPLTLTLDPDLQAKAQSLLTRYGPASALVAIRPSTGELLVAASGPGSGGYNTATFGQYAPGSTFKVVSSLALLRAGLTPSSKVTCPPTVTVNGKQFKNYSDYPGNRLGTITLRQAVANSCNTAFISSREKITGTALADAAAALGFGVDHDLGFPAYFGQVPPPAGATEAAADLIGQGKVLASPMAMAAVVASVVRGATVVPSLITGGAAVAATPAKPLTAAEAASLRTLMRAVVEEGSGSFLQSLGSPGVLAKTGTAEYGDASKTHTWMIGAQGDLAVAVFVETGQSGSRTAGPVLDAFLRAAK